MGIYDREYYRDATRGSGFFSGAAAVCRTLILVNVGVFLAQWFFRDAVLGDRSLWEMLGAHSPEIFRKGHVWQLLTATFLHSPGDIFHIAFNMLILWFVGREMEAMYGPRDFLALYLAAAVFSTFCWAAIDYGMHGADSHSMMLGASGAIMAVLTLYTLYNPRREMLLFGILPVEMWMLLGFYLGADLFRLLSEGRDASPNNLSSGGTALASHLSGAAFGFLFKHYDLRWSRLASSSPWGRPRLRIVSPEPRDRVSPITTNQPRSVSAGLTPRTTPATTAFPEEQLDARLDEVLVKIASEGREGLTVEENRILQEASRRARSKRSDRS